MPPAGQHDDGRDRDYFVELDAEVRSELANVLDYRSWEHVPATVKRVLRARDTKLEPILNGEID